MARRSISLFLVLCGLRCAAALSSYTTDCTLPPDTASRAFYYVSAPNVRGSIEIVWLCLSTLIICSYQVLHLNIKPGRERALLKAVGFAIFTILAPEIILWDAVAELSAARKALKSFRKSTQLGECRDQWTLTHMFYANAFGFMLRKDGKPQTLNADQLLRAIEGNILNAQPPLTKDEIMDKSKDSAFTKSIAVFQIAYFYVQFFARIGARQAVTQLELSVASVALFSLITYLCLWYKPKGVETPTYLEVTELLTQEATPEEEATQDVEVETKPMEKNGTQTILTEKGSQLGESSTDLGPNMTGDAAIKDDDRLEQGLMKGPESPQPEDGSGKMGQDTTTELVNIKPYIFGTFSVCPSDGSESEMYWVCISSIALGAVHLAAWNFDFPTLADKWVWRVSSIVCTASVPVGILIFAVIYGVQELVIMVYKRRGRPEPQDSLEPTNRFLQLLFMVAVLGYFFGRVMVIVESVRCLFFLPSSAYEATSWASSFPHFG